MFYLLVTEPLCGVLLAELLDYGDGRFGNVTGEVELIYPPEDDVVDFHGVARGEGRSETEFDT